MDSVIKIRDLSYAYRRQENRAALSGVSLTVERGEFVGIAGRAGSGKSTLCYALNGLIPHSFGGKMHGEVSVCGINTREVFVPEIARKVGFVLQNAESQLVGLSVDEDVAFGLENIGLPREEIKRRVSSALDAVRLTDFARRSPWTLSGGQKQRLAIAAAMAFEAEVLVLDNPTAELDPVGKLEVMATLAQLNIERRVTLIVVNQELEEIVPYASRLVLMDAGRIVKEGSPREVVNDAMMVEGVGVKLPEVAQVCQKLRERGSWAGALPLTVDEAAAGLAGRTPSRGIETRSQVARPAERLIEFQNVSFSYLNGTSVLRNVSLTIRRGEFVTLMGPNGAGKTTLAKHFNGLHVPTSGSVRVGGIDTREATVAQLARTVGYVFQNPDHQLFARSVEDELSFGPCNLKWPARRRDESVRRELEKLGGKERAAHDPFFLGMAERKLVAIASVLVMEPQLLVLDEPATGADHEAALRIMHYLAELHRNGLTIVIVTHDVSLAAKYADRIVVLQSGSIVLDGPPAEVLHHSPELQSSLVTPPQVAQLAHKLQWPMNVCSVEAMVEQLVGK